MADRRECPFVDTQKAKRARPEPRKAKAENTCSDFSRAKQPKIGAPPAEFQSPAALGMPRLSSWHEAVIGLRETVRLTLPVDWQKKTIGFVATVMVFPKSLKSMTSGVRQYVPKPEIGFGSSGK